MHRQVTELEGARRCGATELLYLSFDFNLRPGTAAVGFLFQTFCLEPVTLIKKAMNLDHVAHVYIIEVQAESIIDDRVILADDDGYAQYHCRSRAVCSR